MKDLNGSKQPIQMIKHNEPMETLVVMLAANGNEDAQVKSTKNKAISWSSKIKQGWVYKSDAWTCVNVTIVKTLEYPFPVTCLTERERDKIMSLVFQAAPLAVGICLSFPRINLQAPGESVGTNLPNFYVKQGSAHLDLLMIHWNEQSTTCNILR